MRRRALLAAVVTAAALSPARAAEPAPVRILAPLLVQGPVTELEPLLRARVHAPVIVEYSTMMRIGDRLRRGDAADLAFISRPIAEEMIAKGRARSHTDLATSQVGLAVADDAPVPSLKSTEDFVAFLKATPSIAYFAGGSGNVVVQVMEKQGIADLVKAKAVVIDDGPTAALMKQGRVASAVQAVSELKFGGARNIVELPEALQTHAVVGLTELNGQAAPGPVAEAVRALQSPEAMAAFHRFGLEPAAVRLLGTIAVQGGVTELAPVLRTAAGGNLAMDFAQTTQLQDRLARGERADVVIFTSAAVDQMAAKGQVAAQADLIESSVALAVADDARLPRMRTTADFVAFLKATPSIAYTATGVSGMHVQQLIQKLGLDAIVRPKATIVQEGFTAALLRAGRVASAIQQVGELRLGGAKNIVPLPEAVQLRTVFTAAVLRDAPHPQAAAALLKSLTSPDAAATYRRWGVTPPLRVLVSMALEGPVEDLTPEIRARAGVPVAIEYSTMARVVERLGAGERPDVVLLSAAQARPFADKGLLRAQVDIAQGVIGLAVPEGTAPPVLATPEDFIAFLKATPSLALFSGASGTVVQKFIAERGLADLMRPKLTVLTEGATGTLVRDGKVAAAVQQLSELKAAGATNTVPLPEAVQVRSTLCVVVMAGTAQPDAATRVVQLLSAPGTAATWRRYGLEPVGAAAR